MSARLEIHFQLMGEEKFARAFDHIEHIPDDFRPAWEGVAEDFWEHERETFDAEGPGWRPLSPRYKAWKDKRFPGAPILVRTGALRNSLTDGNAPGAIYDVRPLELQLGTDLKTKNGYTLGTIHQTGSLKVRDRPPKRPPVNITMGLRKKWNKRLERWLRDELNYQG